MEDLKSLVRQYREQDNQVRELNKQVANAREIRKTTETSITTILRRPEFVEFEKLQVSDDNSVIHIRRPDQWNKPWSISKNKLAQYISDYFQHSQNPNAQDCYNHILQANAPSLKGTEFCLERVVKD